MNRIVRFCSTILHRILSTVLKNKINALRNEIFHFMAGPGCSKQSQDNRQELVRNLNSDMKAEKENSVLLFLSTI